MALNLTRAYTYAPNATIASSENNTNENTLYNAFSGLEAGTSSMAILPLDTNPTSALHAATKQYVDVYAGWRRPNLTFVSVTTVDVESNTGTANQTKIVFPDGNSRSVTEDTASTTKYRRFDITATAQFTSGTEDSGLRSSLSEVTNTWYAIYAVKSSINTANFVLVGDTLMPTQANFATLNSNFGTNGWLYLGRIRNGDKSGATGDILNFSQQGHFTIFKNTCAASVVDAVGIRLANSASASSLAYSLSSADVPSDILVVGYYAAAGAGSGSIQLGNNNVTQMWACGSGAARFATRVIVQATDPVLTNGSASAMDIHLWAFFDPVLGVGSNPLI